MDCLSFRVPRPALLPLLGCLLAGASGLSDAAVTLSKFPPNPGLLPGGGWQFKSGTNFADPPPARAWTNGVYGGAPKAVATDTHALTAPGRSGPGTVTSQSTIGLGDMAAAIASCIGASLPVCAAGSAAAAAVAAWRIFNEQSDGSPGLSRDPGIAPESQNCYGFSSSEYDGNIPAINSTFRCTSTATALVTIAYANANASNCSAGSTRRAREYVSNTESGYTYRYGSCVTNGVTPPTTTTYRGFTRSTRNTTPTCPASIDPLNPAYSIPSGSPIGVDGKCPTARYNRQPITPNAVGDVVEAHPPTFPDNTWRDAIRDAIDTGGQTAPAAVTSTGPTSVVGSPTTTTTTGPTGTTTSTKTPTYTYIYEGDKITYGPTTVTTTIINNAGDTTTITEVVPPEAKTQCEQFPDTLGCQEFGEADSEEVPEDEIEVTITPTGGWGADTAACPAPRTVSVMGTTLQLSYDPACQAAGTLRYVLIALAWIAAAFIVSGQREGVD